MPTAHGHPVVEGLVTGGDRDPFLVRAVTVPSVTSGYDALPSTGQAAFFGRYGVREGSAFHQGGRVLNSAPTRPRLGAEATKAAWSPKLGVDAAAAIVAMCGDRATLDEIARRDRRKTVQLALMSNPYSDHRYCWERDDRRLGDWSDSEYDTCLARRTDTVEVEHFARILAECSEYRRTRVALLADERLGSDEFHDVVLDALERIDVRRRFDANARRRATTGLVEAAIDRLTHPTLPVLSVRAELIEAFFARPVTERTVATFAATIDDTDEAWFLSLLPTEGGTDIRVAASDTGYVDGLMYEVMAQRPNMSPAWYRIPIHSTSQRAVALCAQNPDVSDEQLGEVGIESFAVIGRLGAHWGDHGAAWALAAELLTGATRPHTMGELVALVDAAIG